MFHVSIQLISLASRELSTPVQKSFSHILVSIQLISLASREFADYQQECDDLTEGFHSINFSSE